MLLYSDVAAQYTDFAGYARGESPCFTEWALGVAADHELRELIATLPPVKQQPNLVFAAARWAGVPAPAAFPDFRRALLARWDAIRDTVLARSTQTNEVGRLATLLPAFAEIQTRDPRPLALLEVGTSAGLCLYPDRYDYAWSTSAGLRTAGPTAGEAAAVLGCQVSGAAPLPARLPTVRWRGGVDLNPLDVHDDDAMAWLQILVWPEQEDRRLRLAQAIEVARRDPPTLRRGDLLSALPEMLLQVPDDLTLIVFHSAVIAYLEPAERVRFQRLMTSLVADGRCHWVSNEGEQVLPEVSASAVGRGDDTHPFVLGIDGRAVARTHGHGTSMEWA